MTLNELAITHDTVIERVTPWGTAQIVAGNAIGDATEFDDPGDTHHYSFEIHNLSEAQMAAILAALGGGR